MQPPFLGHIGDLTESNWTAINTIAVLFVAGFVLAVALEHSYVKYGQLRVRDLRSPLAIALAFCLAALVAPAAGSAQNSAGPVGLPDLISDPPFIWFERDVHDRVTGEVIHVLTFDGFLHNIGEGALDLQGNPQVEGGVKQRVFDGSTWNEVATPTVRFENDDGHDHFHLINAAAYSLWNEAQTEQVTIGSKIGFCLLDTFQLEDRFEIGYEFEQIRYCKVNEPDATELRMGITPGWQDAYEASLPLQWVDVSNTAPGRYWIGAVVDPKNEIVESNEDNNGNVFSVSKHAVSGYNARSLSVDLGTDATDGAIDIVLKADVFGTVGAPAFVVADEPSNGSLSVPTGFDILDNTITYVPDAGFTGTDSFTYYAHDTNSQFPFDPVMATVEVQVAEEIDGSGSQSEVADSASDATITVPSQEISASRYEVMNEQLAIDGAEPEDVRWFAKGLPAGLTIDEKTGLISGHITEPGDKTSEIIAHAGMASVSTEIAWSVEDRDRLPLLDVNDFSMPRQRRDTLFGTGRGDGVTTYEATGLPEGMGLTAGQPTMAGPPAASGVYEIVINEMRDGEIIDSVSFELTVRNAAVPAFAL